LNHSNLSVDQEKDEPPVAWDTYILRRADQSAGDSGPVETPLGESLRTSKDVHQKWVVVKG